MERLKTIHFKEMLHAWSMSVVLSQQKLPYKSKYALVALDTLLMQSGKRVTLDDEKTYKQLTVKTNGGGIVERNEAKKSGKEIKTRKQTLVKGGQFLFSKIDARNGAFGIVPKELDGAVVTAEFPVFTVNKKKVMPEFLLWVMTSDEMVKYIKDVAQGSTNRKRLDVETFLSIKVPLPTLDEQKVMMDEVAVSQKKIRKIQHEQDVMPETLKQEVLNITKTEIKRSSEKKGLRVLRFREMETWSVESALEALKIRSDYPQVKIGDWISAFQKDADGGSLRVTPKQKPADDYLYIGMEDVEKSIGRMNGYEQKKGAGIKSNAFAVPFGYYIFGRLRPNLNKYWVNTDREGKNIVCSTEFFVFSLKAGVDRDYFECMLGSEIVQEQIKKYITGTGLPRINATDFLHLTIPNPPAEVQRKLGAYFKSKQQILWNGRRMMAAEKEKSKKEFESQIFE